MREGLGEILEGDIDIPKICIYLRGQAKRRHPSVAFEFVFFGWAGGTTSWPATTLYNSLLLFIFLAYYEKKCEYKGIQSNVRTHIHSLLKAIVGYCVFNLKNIFTQGFCVC